MTRTNIRMEGLFWGCLWRASRYESLLGAAFGGVYGAVFGTLSPRGHDDRLRLGALAGALVGLPLGLIDGLLLAWLAISYRQDERPYPRRYRLQAGTVCALGNLLALVGDWALHGLPRPNYFATSRAACLSVYLTEPPCSLDEGISGAMALTIWVFVPLAVLASWLTGRRVAGWYATTLSESCDGRATRTRKRYRGPASGLRPAS